MSGGLATLSQIGGLQSAYDRNQRDATDKLANLSSGTKGALPMNAPNEVASVDKGNVELIMLRNTKTSEKNRDSILQLEETALDSIIAISSELRTLAVSTSGFTEKDAAYDLTFKHSIEKIEKLLNQTNQDGHYLFGGTDVTTPPVKDLSKIGSTGINGSTNTDYYQGNNITDENTHLVLANDPGFARLIQGVLLARDSVTVEDRAEASKWIAEGIKKISEGPASTIRLEREKIEKDLFSFDMQEMDLDSTIKEEMGVNTAQALTEAQMQKIQLQISAAMNRMLIDNLHTFAQQYIR